MAASWQLWRDRRGQLSWLRVAVLVLLFAPGLYLLGRTVVGTLGARPLTEIIHQTGLWMIRFLFLSLAMTPLRQAGQWPQLITVRRMIGVASFVYGAFHFSFYVVDQNFNLIKVASEIVLRIYLTIGFVAFLGLAALAATSTDSAIRKMGGKNWRLLHRLIYPIGLLAAIHYFLQSKLEVTEATVMAGLYIWLMLYRAIGTRLGSRGWAAPELAGLAILSAALTAGGEAYYFWAKNHIDPSRILATNLSLDLGVRPAVTVLVITLAVAVIRLLRGSKAKATPGVSRNSRGQQAVS